MMRLIGFAWDHRSAMALLAMLAAAALAGMAMGAGVDEATRRHRCKQLREVARMPERLMT
ncbi:MAG: hypothetical protein KKF41_00705 [Actinobacteria bacterium]|nr:hypothetical protein [Actinomycetota bacterium]MBU1942764.1 hypothetical protein [Actinomycetota bacterium]MBU2686086.1 hypothetical protein [Actinomycetota bacterium]